MSWRRQSLAFAALICALGVSLAGCGGIRPLYGTAADGSSMKEAMAAVDIEPIPGRVGQKLRNELIFTTTGGGAEPPTRYRLDIVIKESVANQLVLVTGDATAQVYQINATFTLVNVADGKVLVQGKAISRAPYDRYEQIFANVRARYDAENRAARTIADNIRSQIAAYLANPTPRV
ncbi:MAG TPA: LPS assembly lipoprotein LptE [Methyloceanibacter sp.]|jgi:LPS-assembly lipoprotein|nr:LPS assembly lipoprotein LptE [Methyloceanibacter sp.]